MKIHVNSSSVAVLAVAVSLIAPGQRAYAQESPLLDREFWKAATVEEVTTAISIGANVKARGLRGITPLHYAAHFGNPEVVLVLLDKGADVNAQTARSTPLHFAAEYNANPEVVRILLDKGADVNARTRFGFTPLHFAAIEQDNPEVVLVLRDRGADVNARARYGNTPFDFAKLNANREVARVLLGEGAEVIAPNRSGELSNPDSGNSGTVRAKPAFRHDRGEHCREFQQKATIDNETQDVFGIACRRPDGSWEIAS